MNATDFPETQSARRGHVFYGESLEETPALYETEETPAEHKIITTKYFGGSGTWFIAEYNPETGVAYGYCDLGLGFPEWGYVSLPELEELNVHNGLVIVERDLDFQPTRFGDLERSAAETDMENSASAVKLANALVQNLSIFDGAGYDRMGDYAQRFLSVLAEDGDLAPLVAEYQADIVGLIESVDWLSHEPFEKATTLATLTANWVRGTDREAQTQALIRFHR